MTERISSTSFSTLPRWQRALVVGPAVAGLCVAATSCGSESGGKEANASASTTQGPLAFEVHGKCSDDGASGELTNTSSGFTPGENMTQHTITQPDGQPYTRLVNGGYGNVDSTGASEWKWPCEAVDPHGVYTAVITDLGPDGRLGGGDDRTLRYSFHVADGHSN